MPNYFPHIQSNRKGLFPKGGFVQSRFEGIRMGGCDACIIFLLQLKVFSIALSTFHCFRAWTVEVCILYYLAMPVAHNSHAPSLLFGTLSILPSKALFDMWKPMYCRHHHHQQHQGSKLSPILDWPTSVSGFSCTRSTITLMQRERMRKGTIYVFSIIHACMILCGLSFLLQWLLASDALASAKIIGSACTCIIGTDLTSLLSLFTPFNSERHILRSRQRLSWPWFGQLMVSRDTFLRMMLAFRGWSAMQMRNKKIAIHFLKIWSVFHSLKSGHFYGDNNFLYGNLMLHVAYSLDATAELSFFATLITCFVIAVILSNQMVIGIWN